MRSRSKRILKKESSGEEKRTFFKKKSSTKQDKSGGFFSNPGISPKLKMSKPGDKSEQQADAVADRVVKGPSDVKGVQSQLESGLGRAKDEEKAAKFELHRQEEPSFAMAEDKVETSGKLEVQKAKDDEAAGKPEVLKAEDDEASSKHEVQRAEEEEKAGKKELQRAEDKEEAAGKFEINRAEEDEGAGKSEIQKAEESSFAMASEDKDEASAKTMVNRKEGNSVNGSFEKRLKKAKSGGFALPEKVREEMESKMKKDFSKVRIHTNEEAIVLCREIKAQAFTNGYHIFFNQGKFQPDSSTGKHLLAHELTHVVQQKK